MSAPLTKEQREKKYHDAVKMVKPFIDLTISHSSVGVENIPKSGGVLLASNHRSDLDPLIISQHVPRYIAWIGASYVFKLPLIGKLLEELGTIPISGAKTDQINAFKKVSKILKDEQILGIFPEGHDYMLENDFSRPAAVFHSGFARFAIKLQKPVLPVAIIGIEEKPEPIPVPAFLREWMGFPKEVLNVRNRLMYRKVKVVFGQVIPVEEYLAMPDVEEAIEKLSSVTRRYIFKLIEKHAYPERRSREGGRRSGTRIAPDQPLVIEE